MFALQAIGLRTLAGTNTAQLSVVSSASYQPGIAPGSLATAFGPSLSTQTAQATLDQNGDLPTSLAGVSVQVAGESAELLYVSPTQINFLVPDGTPVGDVTVQINSPAGASSATTSVLNAAPGIFFSGTLDKRGAILNAVTYQPDPFTVNTPQNAGSDKQTYLAVFGTGLRYAGNPSHDSSDQNVAASVTAVAGDSTGNQWPLTVEYAGPAPGYAGLDQINVVLPSGLDGVGLISVWLIAESRPSNAVELTVRYQVPTTVTSLGQTTGTPGSTITIAGAGFGVGNGSTGLPRTTVLFNLTNGEQLLSPALGGDNASIQATVPLILGTDLQPFQGPVQVCVSSDGQQSCADQQFLLQALPPAPGQLGDTLLQAAQQVLQSSVSALSVLDPTGAAALQASGNTNIQNLQSMIAQLRAGQAVTIQYTDLNGLPATTSLDANSIQLIESMLATTQPASALTAAASSTSAGAVAHEAPGGCVPLTEEAILANTKEQYEIVEKLKNVMVNTGLGAVVAFTVLGCVGGGPPGCGAALESAVAVFEASSGVLIEPLEFDLFRIGLGANYLSKVETPVVAPSVAQGEVSDMFSIKAEFGPAIVGSFDSFLYSSLTEAFSEAIPSKFVPQLAKAIVAGITAVVSIPDVPIIGTAPVELGGASLTPTSTCAATNTCAASIQLACGTPGSTVTGLEPTAPDFTSIGVGVIPEKFLTIDKAGPSLQGQVLVTVDPKIAKILISPAAPAVAVGQTITLTATAVDANQNPVPLSPAGLAWTSLSSNATVDERSGVVTGDSAGTAQINVIDTKSGITASVTVTVTAPAIAKITISQSAPSVDVGQTITLGVNAFDANHNPIPIPASAQFQWTSSNTNVATVTGSVVAGLPVGNLTGEAAGAAVITVTETTSMKAATVTVSVGNPINSVSITAPTTSLTVGGTAAFIATALGANGAIIPSPPAHFAWTSSAPAVATVSSTGAVVGIAAGNAIITATETTSGKQATVSVTVSGINLAGTTWIGTISSAPVIPITLVFDSSFPNGAFAATFNTDCPGQNCSSEAFSSGSLSGSSVILSCGYGGCWDGTPGSLQFDPTDTDSLTLTVAGNTMSGTYVDSAGISFSARLTEQ